MNTKLSFDSKKTKAILVGTGKYDFLDAIPAAINNVNDFADILLDQDCIGLPAGNIIKLIDKRNDEINRELIRSLNNEEIETLIFYYAGHGIRNGTSRQLFLTGTNSDNITIRTSGLPFDEIKHQLENSQIPIKLIIIDACYSGLATMDGNGRYTKDELNIRGSFILTSSRSTEKSFFNSHERNTYFTSELCNILREGIFSEKPFISLEDLFNGISIKNIFSDAQRSNNLSMTHFFIAKNKKCHVKEEVIPLEYRFQHNNLLFADLVALYCCKFKINCYWRKKGNNSTFSMTDWHLNLENRLGEKATDLPLNLRRAISLFCTKSKEIEGYKIFAIIQFQHLWSIVFDSYAMHYLRQDGDMLHVITNPYIYFSYENFAFKEEDFILVSSSSGFELFKIGLFKRFIRRPDFPEADEKTLDKNIFSYVDVATLLDFFGSIAKLYGDCFKNEQARKGLLDHWRVRIEKKDDSTSFNILKESGVPLPSPY